MLAQISIYHDTRRARANGTYPVKILVYMSREKRYYYGTGVALTEEDFQKVIGGAKIEKQLLKARTDIRYVEAKAIAIKNSLDPFTIDRFNKKFLDKTGSDKDVFTQYQKVIQELDGEGRIRTGINYHQSQNSIKQYLMDRNKPKKLSFDMVTVSFLKDYEKWMLSKGRGLTTVGIYLRPLRSLFNAAINEGDFPKELYPFGKRLYQIPAGRNVKKALSKVDLQNLHNHSVPQDSPMYKARAFWFFSFNCNGMNLLDIASITYENISGDTLSFIRGKTRRTTRGDMRPIQVHLGSYAKRVIEEFGNKKLSNNTYVFDILRTGMTESEKVRAVQIFNRYINQHFKRFARLVGVDERVSFYWARHSYATRSVHNGASLEYVSGSLGHQNLSTTQNYWAGFEESVRRDLTEKLMEF